MDTLLSLPDPAARYSVPLRGRLAVQGLQGTTAADVAGGGMPERIGSFGRTGDRLEVDVPNLVQPRNARGEGANYTPHPYLPSAQHLDYVHKLTSTSLLTFGVLLILYMLLRYPRTAGGLLARGGLKQAGIA